MLSQRTVEKRVEEQLANDDRWKVIVRGNNWLCPYCLRIGARNLRMDETIEEKIALHFVRECTGWNYFNAEPEPIERLRHRARYLVFKGRVVGWIVQDRRFRFFDDASWLCPYCADTVEVTPPEHALDDLSAWGPSPEESPFLERVVGHLLECEGFSAGEDKLRSVRELEETRVRGKRRARLDRVKAMFKRMRSFQLVDQERRWLCPFCATAQDLRLGASRPDNAFFEGVSAHLDLCKAYKVLGGKPRPFDQLREKIEAGARARQLDKIRHKVSRHSIWRVRDLDGHWYCPYCTQATLVPYPEKRPDGTKAPEEWERFLQSVLGHLSGCEDYRRPKSKIRKRAEMAQVIQASNLQIDRHRRVRKLLLNDPLYGVTDPFQNWLCPHCRRVQKQICLGESASESAVFDKTIEQVVAHFAECEFQEGTRPDVTRQELEALVEKESLRSSGVRERGVAASTDSMDEERWAQIKQDLESMKSRVEGAQRTATSLREARSKQLRLLPSLPNIDGFEFGRIYKPCDAVGGDFYHVFQITETTWGFAIGDIAGHGIEAALLMGLAKKLIEVHGRSVHSPAQALCLANRDIYSDLDERTFVTVFYGVLDVQTCRFKFARAGHDPLLLYNERRGAHLQIVDSKGMALGMDEGPLFERTLEELEVALQPGDLILQYTDGVTETMDGRQEQFGREALCAVIEEHGRHEVEYLLWKIDKALDAFRGPEPQSDDVTMIGFKVQA